MTIVLTNEVTKHHSSHGNTKGMHHVETCKMHASYGTCTMAREGRTYVPICTRSPEPAIGDVVEHRLGDGIAQAATPGFPYAVLRASGRSCGASDPCPCGPFDPWRWWPCLEERRRGEERSGPCFTCAYWRESNRWEVNR
jgi:hypothetical protein